MINPISKQAGSESKELNRILVIYENTAAREHAWRESCALCEAKQVETIGEPAWYSFRQLADSPDVNTDASARAAAADLIIFAVTPSGDLPGEIKLWIESWISKRSDREGALVGLLAGAGNPGDLPCLKEIFLRHAARRACMDFLSRVPPALSRVMPNCPEDCSERSHQVTSLLDDILHANVPPPGLSR
jgi:hypothetical protein